MTITPDTCTFRQYTDAVDLDYDMHPDVTAADGVTLYIRHGYLRASVEHADGTNSNITFYRSHNWSTDWRSPNARQRRVLDSIAAIGLGDVRLVIGATAHHLILVGLPDHKGKRRMLARRLGLDAVERVNRYDVETGETRWDMDAVTTPGAAIQYTCSQGWRHTA